MPLSANLSDMSSNLSLPPVSAPALLLARLTVIVCVCVCGFQFSVRRWTSKCGRSRRGEKENLFYFSLSLSLSLTLFYLSLSPLSLSLYLIEVLLREWRNWRRRFWSHYYCDYLLVKWLLTLVLRNCDWMKKSVSAFNHINKTTEQMVFH